MSTERIPRNILVLTQRKMMLGKTSRNTEKFCFIQPIMTARLNTRKGSNDGVAALSTKKLKRVFGMQYSELKSKLFCQGWTARGQGTSSECEKNKKT
jgi:hypothetical protein